MLKALFVAAVAATAASAATVKTPDAAKECKDCDLETAHNVDCASKFKVGRTGTMSKPERVAYMDCLWRKEPGQVGFRDYQAGCIKCKGLPDGNWKQANHDRVLDDYLSMNWTDTLPNNIYDYWTTLDLTGKTAAGDGWTTPVQAKDKEGKLVTEPQWVFWNFTYNTQEKINARLDELKAKHPLHGKDVGVSLTGVIEMHFTYGSQDFLLNAGGKVLKITNMLCVSTLSDASTKGGLSVKASSTSFLLVKDMTRNATKEEQRTLPMAPDAAKGVTKTVALDAAVQALSKGSLTTVTEATDEGKNLVKEVEAGKLDAKQAAEKVSKTAEAEISKAVSVKVESISSISTSVSASLKLEAMLGKTGKKTAGKKPSSCKRRRRSVPAASTY